MAIYIPEWPAIRPWLINAVFPSKLAEKEKYNPVFERGEAINAPPYEGEMFISFTTPLGKVTSVFYSMTFQFRKWGYVRYKIDESIFVSPSFKQYYDITIEQKERLLGVIKSGLASLSQAISDYALVKHDFRKYREFMDYFDKLEKGRKLLKGGKVKTEEGTLQGKEEGEKLMSEGNQTLKSIFIDQVDVHTGEGVALKLIAPRWPTIIVDFMRLKDDHTEFKKIAKDLGVSEAEGVVLATKNKLFLEWRDKMFRPTVIERFQTLRGLVDARKKSIEEYRESLKPTITRYKMINDALESPGGREKYAKATLRPDSQAMSRDTMTIWAWRPFAISEKYKASRESMDFIDASDAGFSEREIAELIKAKILGKDRKVYGLPQEPSVDRVVRFYFKGWGPDSKNPIMGALEDFYHVRLSAEDLYNARQMLVDQFRNAFTGLSAIVTWVWSPYFIFLEVPWDRTVFRLPDGAEMEDLEVDSLLASTYSQNLVIVRCLELIAKEKVLENFINSMLGEYGITEEHLKDVEEWEEAKELMKHEYPEIFGVDTEAKEKEEARMKKLGTKFSSKIRMDLTSRKIRKTIGDNLAKVGLGGQIFRAVGPYEFSMQNRMAKQMQREPGGQFIMLKDFLKTKFEVPGVNVTW